MEDRTPLLTAHKSCPVCDQGDALVFLSCPLCHHVLLECDEEGSIFRDHTAEEAAELERSSPCPKCGGSSIEAFEHATARELGALGIHADEYTVG